MPIPTAIARVPVPATFARVPSPRDECAFEDLSARERQGAYKRTRARTHAHAHTRAQVEPRHTGKPCTGIRTS